MYKVLLLGATGGLGSAVYKELCKTREASVIKVVRDTALIEEESVFWNFTSKPPEIFNRVDVVINCARSSDYQFNISFNKFLCDFLHTNVRLINISSNCVLAKPRSDFFSYFFRGDAYIREKKSIEKMSFGRKNITCLRPSIVLDEGGWQDFLHKCSLSDKVVIPCINAGSKLKIITRQSVAQHVVDASLNGVKTLSDEMYDEIMNFEKLIRRKASYSKNVNNYFESFLKNILLGILNSFFMPDWLVYKLQSRLLSDKKNNDVKSDGEDILVEGMTRLYLFGEHTK